MKKIKEYIIKIGYTNYIIKRMKEIKSKCIKADDNNKDIIFLLIKIIKCKTENDE